MKSGMHSFHFRFDAMEVAVRLLSLLKLKRMPSQLQGVQLKKFRELNASSPATGVIVSFRG